ncbi:MAG: PAS-domain containing protein, partial [Pseudomonadota bacterium]
AAQDAGALVEIEGELSRFIQTLTTTFAHLPIGLAVFDRERDLTLFNPALSDLLGVTPHWLASRPTMAEFLDRLRADGSMPEPRDYGQLRQEFEELKSGSFTGHYEVEWTLPSGRLYRVSGRPHAAGGAALLFEDITRYARIETHYQAEMRQLHGALEVMTGGVAIFDAAGELAYANDAFDDLLGQQFSMAVTPVSIVDVTRQAQRLCRPTPVLGDLRDFMLDLQGRSAWSADLTLVSGETIALQVTPISDGRAVVELRRQEPRSVGTAGRLAATG